MEVYKDIARVQAAIAKVGISKDRKNEQQGFRFRGIDDIYNSLAPLLADYGLCILPRYIGRTCDERSSANGRTLFYVIVEAEFDFVSAKDGSKHTVKTYGEAMDSGDKATNKAMSAAYKYACLQTFAIPTEGDNDADATTHEVQARTQVVDFVKQLRAAETIDALQKAYNEAVKQCRQNNDAIKLIATVKDECKTKLTQGEAHAE